MKGAWRRSAGSSSGSRGLKLCLLEREKAGASKVFENVLIILSTDFFSQQKLIWQDNWSSKNCLSRGKTSVFPGLLGESEEYPG
jgi:hypothetical protein